MDRVVLHYPPGPAARLDALLERTEKLLEPFPCRPPAVFNPWFPTVSADRRRPIRPANPAPRISPAGGAPTGSRSQRGTPVVSAGTPPGRPEKTEEALCVSETPSRLLPVGQTAAPGPHPGPEGDGAAVGRSWSVSAQRGVLPQSSRSLSKRLRHLVHVHRLHPRQRAKWVITEQNCSDVEAVWRSLSRSVRRCGLPTCNANIQRERAEIWVFCDVLYSEQVGRYLKAELRLAGRIHLAVHKLGSILSM
ncbi:shieldin complex subunit 3 [Anableps anableps]